MLLAATVHSEPVNILMEKRNWHAEKSRQQKDVCYAGRTKIPLLKKAGDAYKWMIRES